MADLILEAMMLGYDTVITSFQGPLIASVCAHNHMWLSSSMKTMMLIFIHLFLFIVPKFIFGCVTAGGRAHA